jgi:hypothetical protein
MKNSAPEEYLPASARESRSRLKTSITQAAEKVAGKVDEVKVE